MGARNVTAGDLLAAIEALPLLARLGAIALAIDILLLSAYGLNRLEAWLDPGWTWVSPFFSNGLWNSGDGSLMEIFGLIQLTGAAALMIRRAVQVRQDIIFAVWGMGLLAVVADDGFQWHEHVGRILGTNVLKPTGIGAQELGGLIFWIATGLVFLAGIIGTCKNGTSRTRRISWSFAIIVVPLVVVATGYVLVFTLVPSLIQGCVGEVLVLVRIATKLSTMTALFVLTVCWTNERFIQ